MFRSGFLFLLGFRCLFLCEGTVFPPPNGTILTFTPGSTEKIVWSLSDDIKSFSYRSWTFTSSDGGPQLELTRIVDDKDAQILTTSYEVAVEKPATLVLKNVNLTYNGTYRFILVPDGSSAVVVFIAVKPTATAFPSLITVNEGDNVSCTCQGQGGNPPADVTWYKDNHKVGGTGKEEKTLTLTNVTNEKDQGSYKCVVQSYPSEMFQDEVDVEVIVNYPPKIVVLTLTKNCSSATVECSAEAQPPASFKIFRNKNELVKNEKTYTIPEVCSSHVGNYTCVAYNILGNVSSNSEYLPIPDRPSSNDTNCGTEWYVVVVTLVAGIIIGILFSYIVSCSRRKFGSRKPQSCPGPRACEVDSTYQELDLTKMNTEDNYRSLRVDVANEDDSYYSKLSKTRDVENNYQSLT